MPFHSRLRELARLLHLLWKTTHIIFANSNFDLQIVILDNIFRMKKLLSLTIALLSVMMLRAELPAVTLQDMDGHSVNTATLTNNGKPMIISFWATWCKPCMRELKALHELYADWQDETGVKIVIVSIDQAQDANKVKPLVDGFGWEFDVLLDPNGDFKRAMNVQMVPHVFVLDGKGNVIFNHSGYTDGAEEELYELIKNEK